MRGDHRVRRGGAKRDRKDGGADLSLGGQFLSALLAGEAARSYLC